MGLKKTGNFKKREEYNRCLDEMYHTCRWCRHYGGDVCPLPKDNGASYNVYHVSEDGTLSDRIREVLEPLYEGFLKGMEMDALMLLKPKGQVQSLFYQHREGDDARLDDWVQKIDEAVSKLYQNDYDEFVSENCFGADVDMDSHSCSLWE